MVPQIARGVRTDELAVLCVEHSMRGKIDTTTDHILVFDAGQQHARLIIQLPHLCM
jgi:ABC-type branched-subunit amino acid transport system ATPase component